MPIQSDTHLGPHEILSAIGPDEITESISADDGAAASAASWRDFV